MRCISSLVLAPVAAVSVLCSSGTRGEEIEASDLVGKVVGAVKRHAQVLGHLSDVEQSWERSVGGCPRLRVRHAAE